MLNQYKKFRVFIRKNCFRFGKWCGHFFPGGKEWVTNLENKYEKFIIVIRPILRYIRLVAGFWFIYFAVLDAILYRTTAHHLIYYIKKHAGWAWYDIYIFATKIGISPVECSILLFVSVSLFFYFLVKLRLIERKTPWIFLRRSIIGYFSILYLDMFFNHALNAYLSEFVEECQIYIYERLVFVAEMLKISPRSCGTIFLISLILFFYMVVTRRKKIWQFVGTNWVWIILACTFTYLLIQSAVLTEILYFYHEYLRPYLLDRKASAKKMIQGAISYGTGLDFNEIKELRRLQEFVYSVISYVDSEQNYPQATRSPRGWTVPFVEIMPFHTFVHIFGAEIFIISSFLLLFIYILCNKKDKTDLYYQIVQYSIWTAIFTTFLVWFNRFSFGNSFYFYDGWVAKDASISLTKLVILFLTVILLTILANQPPSTIWTPLFFLFADGLLQIAIMVQHLFILILLLEGITFITIILLTFKTNEKEKEKPIFAFYYLIINGVLSTPFFIGVALLYKGTTDLTYTGISAHFWELFSVLPAGQETVITMGIYWIMITFLFKLASAPLAIWVADIYDAANMIIAAYIMVILKSGMFFIFLKFYMILIYPFKSEILSYIWGVVIVSSLIFSLLAMKQFLLKRVLAYTSINQIGYAGMGLLAGTPDSIMNTILYMLVYFITLMLLFTIFNFMPTTPGSRWVFTLEKWSTTSPFLSFVAVVIFFSFSGIPPFAGFYAKYFLLNSVYHTSTINLTWYVGLALMSSAILLLVYLQLIVDIFAGQNSAAINTFELAWGRPALGLKLSLFLPFLFLSGYDWIMLHKQIFAPYLSAVLDSLIMPNSHFTNQYVWGWWFVHLAQTWGEGAIINFLEEHDPLNVGISCSNCSTASTSGGSCSSGSCEVQKPEGSCEGGTCEVQKSEKSCDGGTCEVQKPDTSTPPGKRVALRVAGWDKNGNPNKFEFYYADIDKDQ